jgi:VWFA-related protein
MAAYVRHLERIAAGGLQVTSLRPHRTAVTAVVLVLVTLAIRGQQPVFKTGVDLVRVDVLATEHGSPIRGLGPAEFDVYDNGVRQRVESVFSETRAADLWLVFDTSESLEGVAIRHLKDAAHALLDGLEEGDRAAIVPFSNWISLPLAMTGNVAGLRNVVDRIRAGGTTALVDALYTALMVCEPTANASTVLLFSDGRDNRSWLSAEQVVRVARETNVTIYAVAFEPPFSPNAAGLVASQPDKKLLGRLAEESGGKLVLEKDSQRLRDVFVTILEELRLRYLLTYAPHGVARAGWHKLQVKLRGRSGSVTARAGYLVK